MITAEAVEARRGELARTDGQEPVDQYVGLMRRAAAGPGIGYLVIAATRAPASTPEPARRTPAARHPSVTRGCRSSG
ncbi:hypothetical protein ACPXCH_17115 [Streptomyces albogriseolus]|uniref:hypothetical protein n=1 Tax=Streptomyces albogriseolus TaxID=1887 RepID=UPI003CF3B49F